MIRPSTSLTKAKTGIQGFDQITGGGLPQARSTLICGGPGCGKTLFAMEFLVRGATDYGEPGVFVAFEESIAELCENFTSVGFDLTALMEHQHLLIDEIKLESEQLTTAGAFDLDGLFLRLADAIERIGAKRVVLDTLERLFASLPNPQVLRTELSRLLRWLKDRGVTVILTAERGDGTLTRYGLEEYVSDCVVVLTHEPRNLISTRYLKVLKYRGSSHGTNEYPFLIDHHGISIAPITSVTLTHEASRERLSSGVEHLDDMLGGAGFYRGSSILVSGTAGTGKTSLAGHFTAAACKRGERVLYFAFEESASQITRNMESIGIDLRPWLEQDLLHIHATRPSFTGLEMHLTLMHKAILDYSAQNVVIDPLNSFAESSETKQMLEVKAMLMRMLDYLKQQGITGYFTSLTSGGAALDHTDVAISSLIDTWILLSAIDSHGVRKRQLGIIKSRGMSHSSQTREFLLTDQGVKLLDPQAEISRHLSGSERVAEENRLRALHSAQQRKLAYQREQLELQRTLMETRIDTLRAEYGLRAAQLEGLLEAEAKTPTTRQAQPGGTT
ncbi:circadian clock protein KaiC [Rhabdochromatium marinum]|uniref:circadian clock protein KaiC n=1 Tax=Rhabdochromatium marinum TaxID=48729 RepID=UPI001908699A|nr:circadian clock protein KaiC [Rhabdochromatium marinum]MBK1647635.1 KaiC 1 [Rhabdochromatium marinum]